MVTRSDNFKKDSEIDNFVQDDKKSTEQGREWLLLKLVKSCDDTYYCKGLKFYEA